MQYNFKEVEKKWSNYWLNNKIYKKMNDNFRPRFFLCSRYINPNRKNINLSEYKSLFINDSIARMKRMKGYNVLYSVAFNSFNKEAEDYGVKTSNSPFDYVKRNINNLVTNFNNLGISYDNELVVDSSNKDFYKWSEWLFTKLYEKGVAELREDVFYYCDVLRKRVKEEEIYFDGQTFRTKLENYTAIEKKEKNWYIKLDCYNDKILKSLEMVNYSLELKENIKEIIGKKAGYNLNLKVDGTNLFFNSYTNRVDNLFGATFCVISPKNKHLYEITNGDEYNDVIEYINNNLNNKDIIGAFTGSFIINPVNGKRLPIWVSNYFMDNYESDFKICIPSCDILDYEFAKNYGLDIIKIIDDDIIPNVFDGPHINSDFADGLNIDSANDKIIDYLIENGYGEKTVTYKLKDICLSNPAYFGEPFPLIYFLDGLKVLNSTELPLELPNITLKETFNEYSPLYNAKEWLNVFVDNKHGYRDINTMNNYASSSWFYLAFILKSSAGLIPINNPDAKYELNKWLPINLYVTDTLNPLEIIYQKYMLYTLSDLDYIKECEPYTNMVELEESVINFNLEEVLNKYGSDVFRLFVLNSNSNYDLIDLDVFRRFIDRLVKIFEIELSSDNVSEKFNNLANELNTYYEECKFKEIIEKLGVVVAEILKEKKLSKKDAVILLKLINPICPFVTEELYSEYITKKNILSFEEWPVLD